MLCVGWLVDWLAVWLVVLWLVGWLVGRLVAVAYREGGFGVFKPPPRNSEDIGGVLDRISKKNRRLDFLLQFAVFSYGCNLLNKVSFHTNCLAVAYLVSEFRPTPTSRKV